MSEDDSLPEERDPLLVALGEVLEATRFVQSVLRESEERTLGNISRIRAGERFTDLVREVPSSTLRTEINEALDRLIEVRQRSCAAMFLRLVEEGVSRKEIATNWGFSQTVVSRVMKNEDVSA